MASSFLSTGWSALLERDSHPLEYTALLSRTDPSYSIIEADDHEDKVYLEKDQSHRSIQLFHLQYALS